MTISRRLVPCALAAAAAGVLLAGCAAVGPSSVGGGTTSGGKSASSPTGSASPAFTPAATPTIMPPGAFDKVSKGGPTLAPTANGPLTGKTVVVDPGHNGGFNPGILNAHVPTPFGPFVCMATGTQSDGANPISEHALNWTVGNLLATKLRAEGATVVLTRPDDSGLGPCNIDRAAIADAAHADLLVSVHSDGQAMGRSGIANPQGFHTQLDQAMLGGPLLYARSLQAAENIVTEMQATAGEPLTNYVVRTPPGIWQRKRELVVLAGLKTTPGVLIEMGNLKNPANLARLVDPAKQDKIADAIAAAVTETLLSPAPTPSPSPTPTAPSPSKTPSKR